MRTVPSTKFSIDIIDPMNRTGKINVPCEAVVETRGLQEYFDSVASMQPKDFSLCLLYQRGACRGGSRCHQIHVDTALVQSLREKASASRSCCALHGDCHSTGFTDTTATAVVMREGGVEEVYVLSSFGRTAALDNQLRVHHRTGADLRISAARLCRLHLSNRCKFGKDCKNIHLCPQAVPMVSPPRTKRSPSLNDGDCGVSTVGSTGSITPRDHAEESIVAPLMQWSAAPAPPTTKQSPLMVDNDSSAVECSGFFFEVSDMCEASSLLDMSAFEETMRTICEDLERAEFSPNTAVRVRSQCNLLSMRE